MCQLCNAVTRSPNRVIHQGASLQNTRQFAQLVTKTRIVHLNAPEDNGLKKAQ